MEIKTKFNIGDTVVRIDRSPTSGPCPDCNGTGTQTIQEINKSRTCAACYGSKRAVVSYKWQPHSRRDPDTEDTDIVSHMNISVNHSAHDDSIQYTVLYSLNWNEEPDESEEDLYPTLEAAQAECDRRNGANI